MTLSRQPPTYDTRRIKADAAGEKTARLGRIAMQGKTMNGDSSYAFHVGDHVALVEDDWSDVGYEIVLVDVEPVPGSTQCVVSSDGKIRTVSRLSLRPL